MLSKVFFNKADGKHWAKFIVVTEKGKEAIRNGWKLSNAYIIQQKTEGGVWHGVDYAYEVVRGEYEHLAIVQNPRYAESEIMSPDEFKAYNENKEADLKRLQNSNDNQKESNTMFFKKEKLSNAKELESTSVVLPKSGKETTILKLINEADEAEMKENEDDKDVMANGDHKVKVGEEEMTVNELVEKHVAMTTKQNTDDADKDAKDAAKKNDESDKSAKDADKQKNQEDEDKKKKENEESEKKDEEKKANALHFEALKNAEESVKNSTIETFELSSDRVARGQSRYGSKK